MLKNIRYIIEGIFTCILFFLFRITPLDTASGIGGWIGKTLGPRLAASRKALHNLQAALPGQNDEAYRVIIQDMWENLGRTMAEYPHLARIGRERVQVENFEILEKIAAEGKPAILVGGHIGNWEITRPTLINRDYRLVAVYRAANNPWTDKILSDARSLKGRIESVPKSASGMRKLMEKLKNGENIGILIDQKYNQGLAIPFFGRPAMTSDAFARMGQRIDCPVVPVRTERLEGAHFKITVYPPLNPDEPVETMIASAHSYLEAWISEKPGQWLWLHRRWDSRALSEKEEADEQVRL